VDSLAPDEINSLAVNENSPCHRDAPWVCCPRWWQVTNKMRV